MVVVRMVVIVVGVAIVVHSLFRQVIDAVGTSDGQSRVLPNY